MATGKHSIRAYAAVQCGSLLSMFGSQMTGFTLSLTVFKRSGLATDFAAIMLTSACVRLVLSPFTGAIIDRIPRRTILLGATALNLAGVLALAVFESLELLDLSVVCAIVFFGGIAESFLWPAAGSLPGVMLPKRLIPRVIGATQVGEALVSIIAPILGPVALASIGLVGVMVIDGVTFAVFILVLLAVPIPRGAGTRGTARRLGGTLVDGWSYVRRRPGIPSLLMVAVIMSLLTATSAALQSPMVLGFASMTELGWIWATAAGGGLVGGAALAIRGGVRRPAPVALSLLVLTCTIIALWTLTKSIIALAISAALAYACIAFCFGILQALLLTSTDSEMHGRVLSMRLFATQIMSVMALLCAAPLADYVVQPRLGDGSAFGQFVGFVVGHGEGRGAAFVLLSVAVATGVGAIVLLFNRPLRRLGVADDPAPS